MSKIKRFFLNSIGFITVAVVIFCASFSGFCVSDNMTSYRDTLYTNSTISNLLSLRQENQLNMKYIGFQNSNYEYVLLLSNDFTVNGKKVTAKDCQIIVYDSDLGSSNATRYYSVSYPSVTLTVNHVVTSNFLEGSSKNETSTYQRYVLVAVFALLACVIFWLCRRFK